MRYSIDLVEASSDEWLACVLANFDTFLQDHADCERKASAMALSLIAKYPNRTAIIDPLIETAIEELEHFRSVYQLIQARGQTLAASMSKDFYIQKLMTYCQGGSPDSRFMNRLLIASIIECRGCERFKRIAEAVTDPKLQKFYKTLWVSEAKHGNLFVTLALEYFDNKLVYDRLSELAGYEAEIITALPIQARLH